MSFLRSVRAMKAPGSESFIRNHSSFLRKGRHYRFCLSWCLSPKEESLTWAPQGARKRGHLSEVDVNSVCVFSGKRRASLSSQKVVWSPFHPGASLQGLHPGPAPTARTRTCSLSFHLGCVGAIVLGCGSAAALAGLAPSPALLLSQLRALQRAQSRQSWRSWSEFVSWSCLFLQQERPVGSPRR